MEITKRQSGILLHLLPSWASHGTRGRALLKLVGLCELLIGSRLCKQYICMTMKILVFYFVWQATHLICFHHFFSWLSLTRDIIVKKKKKCVLRLYLWHVPRHGWASATQAAAAAAEVHYFFSQPDPRATRWHHCKQSCGGWRVRDELSQILQGP